MNTSLNTLVRRTCSVVAVLLAPTLVSATVIERPTNFGIGADAEVRDWEPITKFGFAPELAVRILNVSETDTPLPNNDRNDLMYIKIDLSGLTLANVPGAIFRLSYAKDNQLTQGRVVDPGTGVRAGLQVYGLDVNDPGNAWAEGNINYLTAPGLTFDGLKGDSDYNLSKLSLLGNINFPDIVPQNWFPVGGNMDLSGPALESFLTSAISANKPSVTFVAGLQYDGNPLVSGTSITNRTYLFVHKGITTLNDPAYDADTFDPTNPIGGPNHLASNANGEFSPRLVLQTGVPEPSTMALVACCGLVIGCFRRN